MSYSLTDSQYYIHKVSSYSLVVWDSNYFSWLYCFGGRNPSRPFKLLLIFKTFLSESRSTIASTVALKSEDLFFHVLKVFHINFRFHFKNLLFHIICTFVLCNSLESVFIIKFYGDIAWLWNGWSFAIPSRDPYYRNQSTPKLSYLLLEHWILHFYLDS